MKVKSLGLFAILLIVIIGLTVVIFLPPQSEQPSADNTAANDTSFTHISAGQFHQKIEDTENVIILDVRTSEEYSSASIEGAINMDYYAEDFTDKLAQLDKDQTYCVYCRSGNRSQATLDIMEQLGFSDVYGLAGGINAWIAALYDTTCTTC